MEYPAGWSVEDSVLELGRELVARGWRLGAAESCTGGLASHALTNVSGSSDWFEGGVVVYSNELKRDLLKVDEAVLVDHGAVSEPVVLALARNIRDLAKTDAGFGISGVAGPTGGSPEKPVGTVWMAWSVAGAGGRGKRGADRTWAKKFQFAGSRLEIKQQSVAAAIQELLADLRREPR